MPLEDLRQNDMMAYLVDSLDKGKDIGHFGRLAFVMVARFFADEDEVVRQLTKDKDFGEEDARAMYAEVTDRGYNPPQRGQILKWQEQQDFPICPTPDDPDSCNVYEDFQFPDEVYENIKEYHKQKRKAAS